MALQERMQKNDNKLLDFDIISDIVFRGKNSFSEISKNTHTISAKDNTELVFEFEINSKDGKYTLEYNEKGELISENLDYIINSNLGTLFKVSYHDKIVSVLNKSIFKKGVFKDLTDSVDKFWGKHTFLSICKDYFLSINDEYLLEHVSKNFLDVLLEIHKISICTDKMRGPYDNNSLILNNLDKGEINRRFKDKLLHTEKLSINILVPCMQTLKMYAITLMKMEKKQNIN